MTGNESYYPLVSVIIPNYNHASYLKHRIDSVLNQTYTNIEVILLDDKSTDNSREIIEEYRNHPKVVYIEYNEINSGSTFKQWLKGLNLAKGEWIWIAESDDVANPEFINTLIFSDSENCGVKYCRSNLIDENNREISLYNFNSMPDPDVYPEFRSNFELKGKDFILKFMLDRNSIPNASAVIFRRDLVEKNIFEKIEHTKLFGDWLFWLHLLKNSNVFYSADALNDFRFHQRTVRNETHFTATRLIEYMELVKYLDSEFDEGKKALDSLVFHYLKKEVPGNSIKLKEHFKINLFILSRNPILLLKSYLRQIRKNQ